MAKQPTQFHAIVRDLEAVVGHPVLVRDPGRPESASAVFVAVFGNPAGSSQTQVLGKAALIRPDVLLADLDTVAELKQGATPTMVGFAWVAGRQNRTQARTVRSFGHRETDDPSGQDMWAIELAEPTTAPTPPGPPPGSVPASGWCVLFPWLTMCQRKN
jgi:hypothetical protein